MYWKFPVMVTQHYWLFNTQLTVLQADWLILENNEEATLNISMPYCVRLYCVCDVSGPCVK